MLSREQEKAKMERNSMMQWITVSRRDDDSHSPIDRLIVERRGSVSLVSQLFSSIIVIDRTFSSGDADQKEGTNGRASRSEIVNETRP